MATTHWLTMTVSCVLVAGAALGEPLPLKVFILAGQSNMEGQAVADLTDKHHNDGKGTLFAILNDPATRDQFAHLRDDSGTWRVRDDVWCGSGPGAGRCSQVR